MDGEDYRLFPATLVLGVTASAAVMLALTLAAFGSPFWPLFAVLGVLASTSASALEPNRPWSLVLARWVGPPSTVVWLAALLLLDRRADPTAGLFCLVMAGLCASVPTWLRMGDGVSMLASAFERPDEPAFDATAGWIEELEEPIPAGAPNGV